MLFSNKIKLKIDGFDTKEYSKEELNLFCINNDLEFKDEKLYLREIAKIVYIEDIQRIARELDYMKSECYKKVNPNYSVDSDYQPQIDVFDKGFDGWIDDYIKKHEADFKRMQSNADFWSSFSGSEPKWVSTFGFKSAKEATHEEIIKRFRQLAMKQHPDKGGNEETFQNLIRMRDSALEYLKNNS